MSFFPMFAKLEGRRAVVVGAGRIGEPKIKSLLIAGADVRVIAPAATLAVEGWAAAHVIAWEQREFRAEDLDGAFLVIAATSSPEVNEQVHGAARQRGILCNAVDDPERCDFYYGSVVRRGQLQVAISSEGQSPALAQRLRKEIESQIGPEYAGWVAELGAEREALFAHEMDAEVRRLALHELASPAAFERWSAARVGTVHKLRPQEPTSAANAAHEDKAPIAEGKRYAAQDQNANSTLSQSARKSGAAQGKSVSLGKDVFESTAVSPAPSRGKVWLVGAGPGDPELLTCKALRLLEEADVVLHDDLVSPEILALIPPSTRKQSVGKRCGKKDIQQEEINALLVTFAQFGLKVVRLKSGDPMIFGRAGEEMDAMRRAGVEFEVVPGVTSALGAAASAKVSLTHRKAASAVAFLTSHQAKNAQPADWEAWVRARATLVIYMPGYEYGEIAGRLMDAGMQAETLCAVVSRATRRDEQILRTTLGALPGAARLAAPTLLFVGEALGLAEENVAPIDVAWLAAQQAIAESVVGIEARDFPG